MQVKEIDQDSISGVADFAGFVVSRIEAGDGAVSLICSVEGEGE